MRVPLLLAVVMTFALVGCGKKKPSEEPKPNSPSPAPSDSPGSGVGVVVNPNQALGGGGGGGGVMGGYKAVRRTEALSELKQLGLLIETMYNDLGRMPTATEITESLKRDAPKIHKGITDKAYVLTDTKDHSGLWAYEIGAEQFGGVALIAGVSQRATAEEVARYLPKQPTPPAGGNATPGRPNTSGQIDPRPMGGGAGQPMPPPANVTKQDMEDVRIFIDNFSGASGKMPPPQVTYDALVQAKSPAAALVYNRAVTLTGATTRESVWAYETAALQRGGLICGPNGVDMVTAADLKQRLAQTTGVRSMPTVYVNDRPVEIGTRKLNCIQAADLAGVFIPHYCYHEALSVVASCRMCLVEMGERKPDGTVVMQNKVLPGCQTPVKDGTVVVTGDYDKRDPSLPPLNYPADYTKGGKPGERAKKAQSDTLEGLLINHPLDCPVCDKAGECKLQDFSYEYGYSESRMVDEKNTPPNKPHISSKITLFTDRCIMCTRCVRFTREISGTAELLVTNRGDHEEIDVFPGRPLENKLAGNVVDLCPVGALGSKDFLYKQRVWYLKTADGVCSRCSTGCSVHVDSNKDIVYRLRPRPNDEAEARGFFICDEGRYGYHFANSGERFVRPMVKADGRFRPAPWVQMMPQLRQDLAAAPSLVAVLSPFLTVEEAYLLAGAFKQVANDVRLVLGPVPVVGEDDCYPKDVRGNPPAPDKTKFTIRAEKCPNRRGVEAVLTHFQGSVIPFADVVRQDVPAMWFAGGYPAKEYVEAALPTDWKPPTLLVAQDILPTLLTASAKYVLPATSSFEKEGTFVNHAGLAQTFPRAVRPPVEVRSELQLAFDLLGRRGLAQAAAILVEVAASAPKLMAR